MKTFAAVILAIVALALSIAAVAATQPSETEQSLRSITARFHSVDQATAAGYRRMSPCVSSPAGGMGIHFENASLMADPSIVEATPEILVYFPNVDGDLNLVAIEYWKADADGSLATTDDRPYAFGQAFHGPMPGHNPSMPVHYDLHVWAWQYNPSGLFADFNPTLTCPTS